MKTLSLLLACAICFLTFVQKSTAKDIEEDPVLSKFCFSDSCDSAEASEPDYFVEFLLNFLDEEKSKEPEMEDLANRWYAGRCVDRNFNVRAALIAFSEKNRPFPIPSKSKNRMSFVFDRTKDDKKAEMELEWFDHLTNEKVLKIRSGLITACEATSSRDGSLYTEYKDADDNRISVWLRRYNDDEDSYLIAKFSSWVYQKKVLRICVYHGEVLKNGKIIQKGE